MAIGGSDFHLDSAVLRIHAADAELSHSFVDVAQDLKRPNVRRVAGLEIDRLPNPTGGGVPSPLLAHRLLGVVHRIFDAQYQKSMAAPTPRALLRARLSGRASLSRFQRFGQIKLKRRVPPFVVAQMHAIAPAI